MSSKLKKLKDLERILTVTIPLEDYKDKFQSKINIKGQAKLDGFRKGKVPNDVLEQKYGASIHADVVNDLIQASYPEALKEKNNLRPASSPTVKLSLKTHLNHWYIQQLLKFFLTLNRKFLAGQNMKLFQ